MVRDSEQSVAARPSGQALSGERQRAVTGSILDHTAIRAGPMREMHQLYGLNLRQVYLYMYTMESWNNGKELDLNNIMSK